MMMKKIYSFLSLLLVVLSVHAPVFAKTSVPSILHFPLARDWRIQDSGAVKAAPPTISEANFPTSDWHSASVPSTVLGALIEDHAFDYDPFFGMNLRRLPGTFYEIGTGYNKFPTPPESLFGRGWWYRKEFTLPTNFNGKKIDLHFQGITDRANIWLNGKKISDATETVGTYRTYSFDITSALHAGVNTLAVQVFTPTPTSLTNNWVDWNPTPQDKSMGLWREVYLTAHGDVSLQDAHVIIHLSRGAANLSIEVDASNSSDHEVRGLLKGRIENMEFSQPVILNPHETRTISSPVVIPHPRLWWPYSMGKPNLYSLNLSFEIAAKHLVSDGLTQRFGIREITSELLDGARLFKINGKSIFIRGGGWNSDLFLRFSHERIKKEFQYVKDLNLNTLRLEGRFEPSSFLDLADEEGILILPGWVCCNAWQTAEKWSEADVAIASASLRDEIREFRTHASTLAFLYGSDEAPPEKIEQMDLDLFKNLHWQNPVLSAAADRTTKVGGKTGVKMTGPYNYVAPSYWHQDHKQFGGGWGFNMETSPGPAIPPIESLRQFISPEHLKGVLKSDQEWSYHAGGYSFQNLDLFTTAVEKRYGKPKSVEDLAFKSQILAYEGHRSMFEAYEKNKYQSLSAGAMPATGIIQWMLNSAWPSMIWHLYDYFLRPGGSYYGVKKAAEPVHVLYSPDDRKVVAVNQTYSPLKRVKVRAQVIDFAMHPLFTQEQVTDLEADRSKAVIQIPELKDLTATYFIQLTLTDLRGKILSHNFYWLAGPTNTTLPETFDWKKTNFALTPTLTESDLTQLNTLPPVHLSVRTQMNEKKQIGWVTIENPTPTLALMIHPKLVRADTSEEILPVLWEDNYFSLLPGEKRKLKVEYLLSGYRGKTGVEVEGWNVGR